MKALNRFIVTVAFVAAACFTLAVLPIWPKPVVFALGVFQCGAPVGVYVAEPDKTTLYTPQARVEYTPEPRQLLAVPWVEVAKQIEKARVARMMELPCPGLRT